MPVTPLFHKLAAGALCVLALTSCGRYNYASEPSTEDKKANEAIYGEVGGPAKHTKNTYPDNPEASAKAAELRTKMWNNVTAPSDRSGTVGKAVDTDQKEVAADSTSSSQHNTPREKPMDGPGVQKVH